MNRPTRLSLIAVMLLATTALGTIGWRAMFPVPTPPPLPMPTSPTPPTPAQPRANPVYEELRLDLWKHEQHCLRFIKGATVLLPADKQSQAEQRVRECQNLLKSEREYVENFPAKTIP